MANEKELKKDELTDKEAEKVVGGEDKVIYLQLAGTFLCKSCGRVIMGAGALYQGKYYHVRHLPRGVN